MGANFSCAHFNNFLSSTWFVHYLLSTIQPSGCAFQFCERGCGECLKDVAKMKTLYKELPYLAALSNMFSSQWQLNCHLKSHIVHPMPWMLPILMHISSTFGIDNIKTISEDVQNCRGDPEILERRAKVQDSYQELRVHHPSLPPDLHPFQVMNT